ncbi:DUF2254 domain-containing protein [Phaeovulum sp.]|uniref:DUF2254 domain-containing protein n=1 Tax=Phaeovulum sp. TaxID=2934796 RepID=UPI0039E68EC1
MASKWQWRWQRVSRQIWVPVTAYGVLGIGTALGAVLLKPFIPVGLSTKIGANAVESLLNILATSMLTVTTFSLSIMLAAFAQASNEATPRATFLLKADVTTQRVLATFIGAFIYALVGIIALKTGIYGENGRLVLFLATVLVLALIVANLLRWIAHLTEFGRLSDTIGRVETAARNALETRLAHPYLGAHAQTSPPPPTAAPILAVETGYVQNIDLAAISALAEAQDARLWLHALPGAFVHPAYVLAHLEPMPDDSGAADAVRQHLRNAFSVAESRTFDQDPRFGVMAMTEVASRALSPAVNDPGTGIDVLGRLVRVLSIWNERPETELIHPRLWVPPLRVEDLVTDAFNPIARDGAGLIEVQVRLQKALLALAEIAPEVFGQAVAGQSARALVMAENVLTLAEDKARLRDLSARVAQAAAAGLGVLPGGRA